MLKALAFIAREDLHAVVIGTTNRYMKIFKLCPAQAVNGGPAGNFGHAEPALVLGLPRAAHAGHLQPLVPDVCHHGRRGLDTQGTSLPLHTTALRVLAAAACIVASANEQTSMQEWGPVQCSGVR